MRLNMKNKKQNKEEFFDLYNKIKAREIDLSYISAKDLKKVEIIMEEEVKIKEKILKKLKKEIKLHKKNYCIE